jgi:hypothetical protein
MPIPMVARSKALVCGRSPPEIVGSNPTGVMKSVVIDVFCQVELSAMSLITRPEESYRLWCVVVCDFETS